MDSEKKSVVIAICGKGGVGKTSIAAMMAKILLQDNNARVLAIDADPAVGLASALGIKVDKTVDDIRKVMIKNTKNTDIKDKQSILSNIEYEVFDAIVEKDNLAFLAIGRPEDDGCFCKVNSLLKDIITSIASEFDYIIIDGEAGIEQINRRVMEKVTHLVLVSDVSAKGINVVNTINEVAKDLIEYEEVGVILNRLRKKEELNRIRLSEEIQLLSYITDNDELRDYDIEGKSILALPEGDFIIPIRRALSKLNI